METNYTFNVEVDENNEMTVKFEEIEVVGNDNRKVAAFRTK